MSKEKPNTQQIQYVWGLIAKSSAIDRERNNISLFNVIDQINLSSEAFTADDKRKVGLAHEIVITWRRAVDMSLADEAIDFDCRISLIGPTGQQLQETTNTFRIQENSRRTRQRIRVDGFVVTKPGDYVYRIEVQEAEGDGFRKANEIPFEVQVNS